MHERCPVCHLKFDRGNGYFTGALTINLVVAETIALALWLPLAIDSRVPLVAAYGVGLGASTLLPILGFRHARAVWVALDRFFNPVS